MSLAKPWQLGLAHASYFVILQKTLTYGRMKHGFQGDEQLPLNGQVPALPVHFFDVGVTKSQRYPYSHGKPLKGLEGRA